MAFSSHRTRFTGVLENIDINELKELDFNKGTSKERLRYIEEKYKKIQDFYNTYIFTKEVRCDEPFLVEPTEQDLAEYYKVNVNTGDDLSENINIFKYCQNDATYLLNSRDIERDKQMKYTFLNPEEFDKATKEISLNGVVSDDGTMLMKVDGVTNDYTNIEHKILKKDFLDARSGEVLSEYNKMINLLKIEMAKIKNKEKSYFNLTQIRSLLKNLNDDMILAKIQLQGIRCPAKRLGDESGAFDLDSIDYTNRSHIEQLLKLVPMGSPKPDNDMSILGYDMKVAVETLHKNGTITNLEYEIIECYNSGYTKTAIGKELGLNERMVRYYLNKIFSKVSKYFIVKGRK